MGHVFKSKIHQLCEQNTNEIKQDSSIVKLNISNLHKAVIPQTMSMSTLKSRSFTFLNQEPFSAKLVCYQHSVKLTFPIHPIRCTAALGTSKCCQLRVFLSLKRKGLSQHTGNNEVSSLARSTFYENLLVGQEISMG